MVPQFIHLIFLCYGCTEFAGYIACMPVTSAFLWLFISMLILLFWLPKKTEALVTLGRTPSFFKTYNILCFIIVAWIVLFFVTVNPLAFSPSLFSFLPFLEFSIISSSSALAIGLAMVLYFFFLKHFMLSFYRVMKPALSQEETQYDFLRARLAVPIMFFPPVLVWSLFDDFGIREGMELIKEIKLFAVAPIFLFALYWLSPWLFNLAWRTKEASKELLESLLELSKRSGTEITGVKIWNSFNEPLANAAVAGITKRFRFVFVTDYLLKVFGAKEVEGVVGHELGHLRLGHVTTYFIYSLMATLAAILLKISLVIYFPYFYLHSQSAYGVETLIFVIVFSLSFTAMTRYCERQADIFSLCVTDKDTVLSSLETLKSLVVHSSSWFPKWLLTHPEIDERLENIKNNENVKISSLIRSSKMLRYSLLAVIIVLLFSAINPVTIVLKWSDLYNAAQAGNCRLVDELCNSLPEWAKEHPFVLEQRGRVAMNSGNCLIGASIAFKATFGMELGLVSEIPHHSGTPEIAFDLKVMELILKFFNFS